MADEQQPTKKVVKRVVRKTVVTKPVSDETIRFGRPVARNPRTTTRPARIPVKPMAAPPTRPAKPTSAPRAAPGSDRAKSIVRGATDKTGRALQATRRATSSAWTATHDHINAARSYRLPRFAPTTAAAISGALVGIMTVAAVVVFANIFSAFRGTSTGGGRWGSLSIVVVTFAAFAAGEYLLNTLHVRQPRFTSMLAVCLTLIVILAFLLGVFDTHPVWAWAIMPVLGAAAYATAHHLIKLADSGHDNGMRS